MKNDLQVPPPLPEMTCLSTVEKRIIALVQPFARYFNPSCTIYKIYLTVVFRLFTTRLRTEGMHGPVTFVPMELERFKEGIMNQLIYQQCIKLARIYRVPFAMQSMPYYSDLVSTIK